MFFMNKPKKKNYAPVIIGIVVGVLAALAATYIIVTKVLKKPICCFKKKNAAAEVEETCTCDCECDCEEAADEVVAEICACDCDCEEA